MFRVVFPLVVAAAALCPVAHADDADAKFLASMSSRGIAADADGGQLIADAHAACDAYGSPGMVGLMLGIEARGLPSPQAGYVVLDGMKAYCPAKSPF